MLRTQGIYEGTPIGDKKLHSEVEGIVSGGVSAELLGASALGLQKPFGEQEIGFPAGKIAMLKAETDGTVAVTIADGSVAPCGVLADSFVDTLKSGKATYYAFPGIYFTDAMDVAVGVTYTLNAPLYIIQGSGLSDATRGLLTTDAAKAVNPKYAVAKVTQIPDLANGVLLGFEWQTPVATV